MAIALFFQRVAVPVLMAIILGGGWWWVLFGILAFIGFWIDVVLFHIIDL